MEFIKSQTRLKSTVKLMAIMIFLFLAVSLFFLLQQPTRASPNQPDDRPTGFEELDDGKVWHIWNANDDYYFNATSGIQFTNYYQEYWTHNIFCGGVKISGEWEYYCNDELPFTWSQSTDNETYVNITGWRNVQIAGRTVRFAVRYHLKLNDTELSVQVQAKNIGSLNIPNDIGFAWRVRNSTISGDRENDFFTTWEEPYNPVTYNLSQNISQSWTSLNQSMYEIEDITSNYFMRLSWNESLTYLLNVGNATDERNAPITLAINAGPLNVGQKKGTTFYWIDPLTESAVVVNTSVYSAPTGLQPQRKIFRATDGTLAVLWTDNPAGTANDGAYMAASSDNGTTWGPKYMYFSPTGGGYSFPDGYQQPGNSSIHTVQGYGYDPVYVRLDYDSGDKNWTNAVEETIPATDTSSRYYPSIFVDSNDRIWTAWGWNGDIDIYCSDDYGSTWINNFFYNGPSGENSIIQFVERTESGSNYIYLFYSSDTNDMINFTYANISNSGTIQSGEFFENCNNIGDWVITDVWKSQDEACYAEISEKDHNMTSQAIDLSASNIGYANLTFYYHFMPDDVGQVFKVYANSSTDAWTEVFSAVDEETEGDIEINLSQYISLDDGVHIRGSCLTSGGICIWDSINVTSYDIDQCDRWNSTHTTLTSTDTGANGWTGWSVTLGDDNYIHAYYASSSNWDYRNVSESITVSSATTINSGTDWHRGTITSSSHGENDLYIVYDNFVSSVPVYNDIAYRNRDRSTGAWNSEKILEPSSNNRLEAAITQRNSSNGVYGRADVMFSDRTGTYEIKYDYIGTVAPKYSQNSTNSTLAGEAVEHRLYWESNTDLHTYIFSFDNGTGTFVNDSWVAFSGTGNWTNVTKVVNSTAGSAIRWIVYANDTSDNWNASDTYQYITISYDDIIFNSSFDQGNLINVVFIDGDADGNRYYTAEVNYSTANFTEKHWWFYYNMNGTSNKIINVSITNLLSIDVSEDRWPNIEPVYSYDNNNTWYRIPFSNFSCCDGNTFNITIAPTEDKVWIAPIPPYPVWKRDEILDSYSSSPYLNVTSLGTFLEGHQLKIATITNSNYNDSSKFKVYIIAQEHSGETIPSWVAQGMLKFLLNESDRNASAIRKSYIFKIILIHNVEGVYQGISRYTPFRGGTQYDPNRAWDDTPIDNATTPAVNWTYEDIDDWNPDAFIDLHSSINNESATMSHLDAYFLGSGSGTTVLTNFMNNVSTGRDGTKNYWPETGSRGTSGTQTAAYNVYNRLNVDPSISPEHPHDNRTSTAQHPTDHNPQNITDWEEWGKRMVLGIYDYYQTVAFYNFQITLPDDSITISNSTGNKTKDLEYNDTSGNDKEVNPCIAGQVDCQTTSLGIYRFTNNGTVTANWSAKLNTSLPSSIAVWASLDNDPETNIIPINNSVWATINSSIPVGVTEEAWFWSNFTDALAVNSVTIRINMNATNI